MSQAISRIRILSAVCAVIMMMAAGRAVAQPRVTIEPREPKVYDTILFSITHSGTLEAPSAPPPASPNLGPMEGIQRQSSFSTITGRTETLSWQYDAMEAGDFSIGPVDVIADGRRVTIPAVTGRVMETPPPTSFLPDHVRDRAGSPNPLESGDRAFARHLAGKAFVLIKAPDTQVVGWPFHVDTYVYISSSLALAEERGFSTSNVNGQQFVTIPELSVAHNNIGAQQEQIGGEIFRRYHVHTTTLVPTRPGRAELRSGDLVTNFATIGRARRSFLTSVVFEPATLNLDIQPLPPPLPGSHLSVVGNHSITSFLDRSSVAQGELVTLTVRVSGNGYLDMTSLERMPEIDGLTFIREEISSRISTTHRNEFAASRTFTRTYQASGTGEIVVPPIAMSNYNPQIDSQEMRYTEELRLTIEPAAGDTRVLGSPRPSQQTQADARDLGSGGILHIDTRPLRVERVSGFTPASLLHNRWYWIAHAGIFCALALMMVFTVHRRSSGGVGMGPSARRKASNPLLRAEKADAEDDTAAFYAALAEALMDQAGRILSRQSRGLTIEDALQGLRSKGVASETISELSALLDRCHSIPYLPDKGSTDRERDLAGARRLVRELGRIKP